MPTATKRRAAALRYGLSKTGDQSHIRRAGLIAYCGKDLIPGLSGRPQVDVVCKRCVQYQEKAATPPPPPKPRVPRKPKVRINWWMVTLPDGYTYRSMNKQDANSVRSMHPGSTCEEVRYEDAG